MTRASRGNWAIGAVGVGWLVGTALVPATAAGMDDSLLFVAGGGALFGLVVIALPMAFLLWRRLREHRDAARTTEQLYVGALAVVASAPAASIFWRGGEAAGRHLPGENDPLRLPGEATRDDLAACVVDAERPKLKAALEALHRSGAAFRLCLRTPRGAFDFVGRRVGADDVVWALDASARETALEDLAAQRRRTERLNQFLDALPWPVWSRGADLALGYCNRAYASALDTVPPVAVAERRELAGAAVAGRIAQRAYQEQRPIVETHHIVVAGSRRLIELTEAPAESSLPAIGFARDITDVETVRAELARHVAAHADVLENVATAISIYGPDTKLKFFNTAFATLWQLEADWLGSEPTLGEVLERLRERRRIPEHADFRAFKKQQLAMFTSLINPQEELLHLPDERTLRLVVSTHPFGGLTFVYEDVTDRLALERSYNTLIEVQRETLDNLYEGIAVFGSDGRLKLYNPAYGRLWGLKPDDLTGEPHVSEIVEKTRRFFDDGGDWPVMKSKIIGRVTSHSVSDGRLERQDDSVLQVATVPLPDGNVLLTYLDVTDSQRVQRALSERNEALETSGRLRSEFIANVSYELRTPLNAIIGFAEILANQYFGELNARQLDYSKGILDSSHRLLSMINDILDLATIEAGYMTLETEAVDIHSMMASVLALTRERARKLNVALEFDCPPDVGTVLADERRLKQALFNLISNAIKFTPAGGRIALSARRSESELSLAVADTGVGIRKEDQERVFEKFERGNPQARQSGAGLGLSLVKSFIELHGGVVEMSSRQGSGTTVVCRLPLQVPSPSLPPASPSPASLTSTAPQLTAPPQTAPPQTAPQLPPTASGSRIH